MHLVPLTHKADALNAGNDHVIIETVQLKPHMLRVPVNILLKYIKTYYVFSR